MKAGKIKDAIVFRGVKGNPIVTSWYPIFLSYGGKFFDNNWKVTFNSAQGKAAAEFFVGKLKSLAPKGVAEYDSDQEGAAILGGKAGAIIQYTGNAIKSDDPKHSKEVGKLDFAVVPKQVKALAQIGIFIHGVSVSAPNKDNAITFMKWFGTDKAQLALAMAGDVPVRTEPLKDPKAVKAHRLLPTVLAQINAGRRGAPAHARLGRGREHPRHRAEQGARGRQGRRRRARSRGHAGHGVPQASGLLQLMAAQRTARARLQGAGFDRVLPVPAARPGRAAGARRRRLPADLGRADEHAVLPLRLGDLERRASTSTARRSTTRSSRARSGRRSSS